MTKKVWKDDYADVQKLSLDLHNPRIPEYARSSEGNIFKYLLENENIMAIATNIAENGYHHSAVTILYEDNGKKIVLDGNRRLAACQLLINPTLAYGKHQNKLKKLTSLVNQTELKRIKITIAPSRDVAEKEIGDIHMNSLLKPWQVIQKLRKYKDLIGRSSSTIKIVSKDYGITQKKMLNELAKLAFYEKTLPSLHTDKDKEKLLKSGFNKIERILIPEHGQRYLGYSVDNETAEIISDDQDIFEKNLKKITPYILNNNQLGPQCKKNQIEEVFRKIDRGYIKTETKKKKVEACEKVELLGKDTKRKGSLLEKTWITDKLYKEYPRQDRVKALLKELKDTLPSEKVNICAVSLRVLLELLVSGYLKSEEYLSKIILEEKSKIKKDNEERARKHKPLRDGLPRDWCPEFKYMIRYMIKEGIVTCPNERKSLETYIGKESSQPFLRELNEFMHNIEYTPTPAAVEHIWTGFGKLLFKIILQKYNG